MRTTNFIFIALLALPIYAQAGAGSHGGDVECDAQIKSITANLFSWIQGGGPEVGTLDISTSRVPKTTRPYTLAEYDSHMSTLLKMPLDSSCVTKGDPGYPALVGDDSKICSSSVSAGQVHIKCDQAKLLGMNSDLQIEQIHHEYATNVPGLEPDFGPISTYKISTQLAAYTQSISERRLVVMPLKKNSPCCGDVQKYRDLYDSAAPLDTSSLPNEVYLLNVREAPIGFGIAFGSRFIFRKSGLVTYAFVEPLIDANNFLSERIPACENEMTATACFGYISYPPVLGTPLAPLDGELRIYDYRTWDGFQVQEPMYRYTLFQYTFRQINGLVITKVERRDSANTWQEFGYLFANLTRDVLTMK